MNEHDYSINNRSYKSEFEKKLDAQIFAIKYFCFSFRDKKKRKKLTNNR